MKVHSPLRNRIVRILIALDIFVFAIITLGNVKRNETISAACWGLEQDGKLMGRIFRPIVDTLLWFDPNHCADAWLHESKLK